MARPIEFKLLGPLQAWVGGRPVRITAQRQLTTLAALLLQANRTVPTTQLASAVWGDNPPATAANQIAICVFAIRRALAVPEDLIVTQPSGYLLRVPAGALDTQRVDELAARAGALDDAGRPTEAAQELRGALELWRGPVLCGVDSPLLRPEITRWEERRLTVTEDCLGLELRLERHRELIGELSAFVADHPLRERPRALLMLALYRAGRQAEALDVYRDARRVLTDELGLEPGAELRALERSILSQDPGLQRADQQHPVVISTRRRPAVPRQLPADTPDHVGRADQLRYLRDQIVNGARICVVAGGAGVGKTALAVHAAHRLHASFPDGQLYAPLNGSGRTPADPAEVLGRFLHALDPHTDRIPTDPDERAERYRALLADRRVLVVLDDAADMAQVQRLLPANRNCAVIVTGRHRMTSLPGVRLLELAAFTADEALELLARIVGPPHLAEDPAATAELLDLCGHLPLALRIAGARLAAKPHWSVRRFVARLQPESQRLDELAHDGLSVRDRIACGYTALDRRSQEALRELGARAAQTFTVPEAARLLDLAPHQAEDTLERLVDQFLLDIAGIDADGHVRYRFPELNRIFTRERAGRPWTSDGCWESGRRPGPIPAGPARSR